MVVAHPDAEFLDMMTQAVTFAAWTGQNSYGVHLYGTPHVFPAHYTQDPRVIQNQERQLIDTAGIIWLYPLAVAPDPTFIWDLLTAAQAGFPGPNPPVLGNILNNSQVTLQDGTRPPIRSAAVLYDDVGVNHLKIVL